MQTVLKSFARNINCSMRQLELSKCILRRMINCRAYGQSKSDRNQNKRLNIDGLCYKGRYELVSVTVPFKRDKYVVRVE